MEKQQKGVANVVRRTWDKEEFGKKAQLRASGQLEEEPEQKKVINTNKEEFQAAPEGAAGPAGSARAFLHARTQKVALETSIGQVKVLKSDEITKSGGYFCEVCECNLKDSVAYLDHINGKRHLRKLGYSMRVERSSVDQVKNRLKSASKRKWDPIMTKKLDALEEHEKKIKEQKEQEAKAKRLKKLKAKARKQEEQETTASEASEKPSEEDDAKGKEEAEMMALMGFAGFQTSKK